MQALMMYSIIAQTSVQANMQASAATAAQQPQLGAFTLQAAQRVKQLTIAFSAVQKALQKVRQ